MQYINKLAARMPDRPSVVGVFSVLVCLLYSWTLFTSFFAFPSWIYFLDISQLTGVYAYAFVLNFIESVFALIIVLISEFVWILIPGVRREDFRSRTVMYVIVFLTASSIRLYNFKGYEGIPMFLQGETAWWVGAFLLAAALSVIAPRIVWLRTLLESFVDRAIIFLYLYLPLSLIALLVVIIRNVF